MVEIDRVPFVSIIIPFHNNQDELVHLVQEIESQDYPNHKTEIICVDNGSNNHYAFNREFQDKVTLLTESNFLNSPYSARNRGIEHAGGEVIVFIDANSVPAENWLTEGVRCVTEKASSGLIAGKVAFDFGGKPTACKVVDAITSINQKVSVENRGAGYTANLFIWKEIFTHTGLFEEGVRSGGDVRWTLMAGKKGFEIQFCDKAVVYKKARDLRNLYKKRIRTGKGYFYSWQKEEEKAIWFYNFFRSLKPPSITSVKKKYASRFGEEMPENTLAVWFHYYASRIIEQLAFMSEYIRYNLGDQRNRDKLEERTREKNQLKSE